MVKFADGQLLKLTSPDAETIVKEVSVTISKWQNQQPVSGQVHRTHTVGVPSIFFEVLAIVNTSFM